MAEALLTCTGTSTGLASFGQASRILHHEPGSGSVSLWAFGVLLVVKALGNETADMFSAFEMQMWPDLGPPPHFQSETDETWILLDGDMTWYVGDKVVNAKPGSHLFLPRLLTHSWRVNANKSARMLVIFSPGRFGDFFMEIGKKELGVNTLPAPEGLVPPVPTEEELAHSMHLAGSKYGIEFGFNFKPQS